MLHSDRQRFIAIKRWTAGEQEIERAAERIEVAAGVDQLALDLLRAHVTRSPHCQPDLGQVTASTADACQPEVRDFDLAAVRLQDVFWFDVPVGD